LLLAQAFKEDYKDEFPDPDERRRKAPYVNEFYLRSEFLHFEGYITSAKLEGIAIWQRSDMRRPLSLWHLLTSGAIWPALKAGIEPLKKILAFDDCIDKKHLELAPKRHWYLWVLAVAPEHQGKGHASQMLRAMFPRIDAEGLPVYLETDGEKNVAFYKHFGFNVLEEFAVSGMAQKLVAMLRQPGGIESKTAGAVLE
jgi:ribosomal protein S18 acetylase RimI-like enzyme